MQRPTLLVLLLHSCFRARAFPIPRPLNNSPLGCLTVIFILALSLTILLICKKTYVAWRRKIDPVSIFSDEFSASTSNIKEGRSVTKTIAKKSGFFVGLLGSPAWETKRSVFVGGPRHISLPSESCTPSRHGVPSGSLTTAILHKVPAQCEITLTHPSNVLGGNSVLPSELPRPPSAMVLPKCLSPCNDIEYSLRTKLSSPLITQNNQHGDFQSNENITLNSEVNKWVLVSSINPLQLQSDHFKVSSVSSFADFKNERRLSSIYDSSAADIAIPTQTLRTSMNHGRLPTDLVENSIQQSIMKPLHRARGVFENSQQTYSDDTHDSNLETRDFSAVSPPTPKASHKISDSPKSCRQSMDLSSNLVRLRPRCPTLTKRTRNSPIIGPSPLRTMSLPADYDLEHSKRFIVDNYNRLSDVQFEAKFEPSLESPLSSSHSSPVPKRSKVVLEAEDPDFILDLIRELAQETSAWDASLFIDKNFKTLMDQSKTLPNCEHKVQTAQEKRWKYRQKRRMTSFIPLQDIPECDGMKCNL